MAADPRSPRSRRPGQRAGPAATATPASGAAGGRGNARIGRCGTGRDGARWPAGGGARGRRDHAGGGGGVRAPGPVHRRYGAGRPRSGADARRGAGDPAGADAVPGGDRNQGVHRPGRPRPRADPAAAARRGRRGISGLPPGGVRGRAVPHARAGRRDRPAPLPGAGAPVRSGGGRGRHLRLPRARRGPLPGPGRPGPGAAAALACAAARRLRQLPDRRRARYRMGQLAVRDPVTLADRGAARGVAGRGRLRRGGPRPHRARGGAGRAERLLPGPAVPALPHRRGPGRRRLPRRRHRGAAGGADPRPGRHRPGRGPPRDAGGSARRPGRSPRRWPPRRATGSPGQEPTRSPGSPPVRRRSAPASSIMSIPRSGTTATPRRSPGCCTGSTSGGPEPTASEPCSPAPHPRPRSSPHSPAQRCPATSRAAGAGPMPGSRQRQARSSSVSAVAAICCHGQATRPLHGGDPASRPGRRGADAGADSIIYRHGKRNVQLHSGGILPIGCPAADDSQFSGLAVFAGSLEEANAIMDAAPAACSPTRSIRCAVPDR